MVSICDDFGYIKGLVSVDDVLRLVVIMLSDLDKGVVYG